MQGTSGRTFFLDAANQNLATIPPGILELRELEEVHLENNCIEEIPQAVQCWTNIRFLYLNNNRLSKLCPQLGKLSRLEGLDLSDNPLLPSGIPVLSGIRSLRQLRLYRTHVGEIPTEICKHLHHLELLGLSGNRLQSLPTEIVNQTKLRELYLKQNQFEVFPPEICVLRNLVIIDLDENRLTALPEEIGSLIQLQRFYVAHNSLHALPESLCQCLRLSVLDVSYNRLHFIPFSLESLTEMTEAGLSGNPLEKVPRLLCKWTALHLLYLCNTGLRSLRRSFRRLVNLRFLDLSQNHMEGFPLQICSLKNLEILALDDNKIGKVPIPFPAGTMPSSCALPAPSWCGSVSKRQRILTDYGRTSRVDSQHVDHFYDSPPLQEQY